MMHVNRCLVLMSVTLLLCFLLNSCSSTAPENNSDEVASADPAGDELTGGDEQEESEATADLDAADDEVDDVGSEVGSETSDFKDGDFAQLESETTDLGSEKALDPSLEDGGEGQGSELNDLDDSDDLDKEMASAPLPMEPGSGGSDAAQFSTSSAQGAVEISDIKYLANQAGGTVVVDTTGPVEYRTRQNESTNQFILELANAHLPKRLKRPYIMKEFEGEFAAINAYQSPSSTTARVVVQLRNPGKALVQQEGNSILILPPTVENLAIAADDAEEGEVGDEDEMDESQEREDKDPTYDVAAAERDEKAMGARTLDEFFSGDNKFYGRRLSIQTKDADVRDALNFIAEYSGINMIISDDVGGTISLKLRDVPWDQALITIMRAKQLGYIRQGNVIRISTLGVLKSESDSARSILLSQKSLVPTRVRVIQVSYANVDNLTKQLAPFLSEGRGRIGFDNRTSSLIVTDTDEVINRIVRLVKNLDIPPMQVMIEGKVVEATEEFQRSVGVNWQFDGENVNLSPSGGANGGPLDLRAGLTVSSISSDRLKGNPLAMSLQVGRLDVLGELGAILSLAESETMVKILSSPRIVTLNNETAQITQEGQILTNSTVVDQAGNKKSSVERTPLTLSLNVTPQITAAGSVILDVKVKRQFASGLDVVTEARAVNTREAQTKVLVDNGQTAVIGGVYQSDNSQGESGVPVLKDIPVLGWLFKSRAKDFQKNELLIFLTPRVINFGEGGKADDTETSSLAKKPNIAS